MQYAGSLFGINIPSIIPSTYVHLTSRNCEVFAKLQVGSLYVQLQSSYQRISPLPHAKSKYLKYHDLRNFSYRESSSSPNLTIFQ